MMNTNNIGAAATEVGSSSSENNMRRMQILKMKISTAPEPSRKNSTDPKRLIDFSSAWIFRRPPRYLDSQTSLYTPHIVSIGPFHRGKQFSHDIEPVKLRYLKNLMDRWPLSLEQLFDAITPLEDIARHSYSEKIELDSFAFVEMLILDGCFITELFRIIMDPVQGEFIISDPKIYPSIMNDLIKLENQIPWVILKTLFDLTLKNSNHYNSLEGITEMVFNRTLGHGIRNFLLHPKDICIPIRHLLHFFYYCLENKNLAYSESINIWTMPLYRDPTRLILPREIPSITELLKAGITVKPSFETTRNFLEVSFRRGTLTMKPLILTESIICLLFNCVAFEQCYAESSRIRIRMNQFSSYVTLLNCLVINDQDVKYLMKHKIIEIRNYSGTEDEVVKIFGSLGKCLAPIFRYECPHHDEMFMEINRYHTKKRNMYITKLIDTYFDSPWSVISILAAFVLLVLTFLQTVYTILGYSNSAR